MKQGWYLIPHKEPYRLLETLPLFPTPSLTVSRLTRYLRDLLESDDLLQDVWVQGEISNYTRATSGHVYLTLKDAEAALRCVIWRTTAARISIPLQSGIAIEAHGAISVYERDGAYQLYIDAVRPVGEGALFQAFVRLKARLEAEGLFDPARKRKIPSFPRRIGLVTSPTGAALQDMLNTLQRRYPLAEVLLAPTSVQGEDAPAEIVHALAALQRGEERPDVILVARGGGSLEDLWAFNDEQVVRAIAACEVPVITGVGHETDFTLADFAADLRAPTPTAAATLATPDRADLHIELERQQHRLEGAMRQHLAWARAALSLNGERLQRRSPLGLVREERQRLDARGERLARALYRRLELYRASLAESRARLQSLNPLSVLQRGFAVIERPTGELVTRAAQATPGDEVRLRLADGTLEAQIHHVEIQP